MKVNHIIFENKILENNGNHQKDSLKKRYLYKLNTNFVSFFLSLVTYAIIPRGLGPRAYGDYNFLTNFFTQLVGFFDMGTSLCFYTKVSQRQREFNLISFYFYFIFLISLIITAFVITTHLGGIYVRIWPDQNMFYVYLAAIWGIITWIVQTFNQMADAYGLTVTAELVKILQRIFALVLVVILFAFSLIRLDIFFYYQFLTLFFIGIAFLYIIKRRGFSNFISFKLPAGKVKSYSKEFYAYCHPLFIYSLVGLFANTLDRWMLQIFAGSLQQGFYSFSYQLGRICFIFTSAMTPLLMREFSISFENKDLTQMAILFKRYIPLLYAIVAYFTCFIVLQADRVIYIMGGKNYSAATLALAIMAFYPLHQTYGQLSGSVFYATGRTRLYRNIGIVVMLLGLPLTYFLIAPCNKMGLNTGANGLAIKMVLINFISVNISLFFNAKLLKLSFRRFLWHQLFSVGCLLGIAYVATKLIDFILGFQRSIIYSFILTGMLYTAMVFALAIIAPSIFGLERKNIQSVFETIKARVLS